jgi:hypothetical protein
VIEPIIDPFVPKNCGGASIRYSLWNEDEHRSVARTQIDPLANQLCASANSGRLIMILFGLI